MQDSVENSYDGTAPASLTGDDPDWDHEAVVVVVGFGGAGAAAALQARESGASVLVLDRFRGGGATSFSGGVLYSGCTAYQHQAGFADTPQEMFNYLKAEGTPVHDETLLRFCEGSNSDLEWLERQGVPYGGNAYLKKTSYPPDGNWLFYSGNEITPLFRDKATPAPRGHRVVVPGMGGHRFFACLRDSALSSGVRVITHAAARRLITDDEGAVIGVEISALPRDKWARHDALYDVVSPLRPFNNKRSERAISACFAFEEKFSKPMRIRARSGVILSTGGFIYNLPMLGRHRPELARSYEGLLRTGSMGCDGSGIALGISVGGDTALMDSLFIGSPLAPPLSFLRGIIVNNAGERFVAEDQYHGRIGNILARQPGDGQGWLILERANFWRVVREALFMGKGKFMTWGAPALLNMSLGGTRRASSIEALAKKCGIDPAGLRKTTDSFNAMVRSGGPDPFGKSPDKLHEITRGPFYAVNLSIGNRFMPTMAFTLGGLVVDEHKGGVLKPDRSPIPGLYAAGRAAVGLCSQGYVTGMSIADTVFSGRRAGRDAACRGRPNSNAKEPKLP